MKFKVLIKDYERGLLFRKGAFVRVLRPGVYHLWANLAQRNAEAVVVMNTLETAIRHPLLDAFSSNPGFQEEAIVVTLSDTERALVWRDERLAFLLGPGRYAFWKTPLTVRVEKFDIATVRFEHKSLATVLQHPEAARYFESAQATAYETVLMYRDGVLVEELGAGVHVFWKGTGRLAFKVVDLREQVADVAGLTSDKVTLRVNLVVAYRVADPVKTVTSTVEFQQALYREAQLVLRAAVGTRALDQLLADKESVGADVRQALTARAAELGTAVTSVGLRDIVLPGDMKELIRCA